MDNLHQSA